MQPIASPPQANQRGNESGGSSCVANKQFERILRSSARSDLPTTTGDLNNPVCGLPRVNDRRNRYPEFFEAVGHNLGIVAPESIVKRDRFRAKGRQQQGAVGYALGTRDCDSCADGSGQGGKF